MKKIVLVVVALVASATVACSGTSTSSDTTGGTSSAASSNPESFCESYCQRNAACDSRIDAQTCTTKCNDAVLAEVQKLRSDVLDSTIACFEAADCREVLAGSIIKDCVSEASVSVAPSSAAQSFCKDLEKTFERCDADLDRASCLEIAKTYSDATIAKAESCLEKSCSSMASCVKAELDL